MVPLTEIRHTLTSAVNGEWSMVNSLLHPGFLPFIKQAGNFVKPFTIHN
jgi:hypothetical protein